MKNVFTRILAILLVFLFSGIVMAADYSGKKVLFVDSYHEGYAWSDGITNSIKQTLEGSGVELKIFRMDTKRNRSDESKKSCGPES